MAGDFVARNGEDKRLGVAFAGNRNFHDRALGTLEHTSDVADMLKGAKGTVVKITISREGYTEPLVFTVTRDEIPRHSVDIAFLLKPGIGYVRLDRKSVG